MLAVSDDSLRRLLDDDIPAGADLLVTSAPYSAPPRDVQVVFSRLP